MSIETSSTDERRIKVPSMSIHGDELKGYVSDDGAVFVAVIDEDREQGAYFSAEQMRKFRDWLIKVLP